MKASTTCPTCGYPEANPELIEIDGYVVGVMFTCVACGGFHSIWHGPPPSSSEPSTT